MNNVQEAGVASERGWGRGGKWPVVANWPLEWAPSPWRDRAAGFRLQGHLGHECREATFKEKQKPKNSRTLPWAMFMNLENIFWVLIVLQPLDKTLGMQTRDMNAVCGCCTMPPSSVFRNEGLIPQLLGVLRALSSQVPIRTAWHRRPHLIPRGPTVHGWSKWGPVSSPQLGTIQKSFQLQDCPEVRPRPPFKLHCCATSPSSPNFFLPFLPSTGIDPQNIQPIILLSEETGSSTVVTGKEFSDSGEIYWRESDKWQYILREAMRMAGYRAVAVWAQERKSPRKKERPLPPLTAPLVASLLGTLRN